jgi:hypothetical protein
VASIMMERASEAALVLPAASVAFAVILCVPSDRALPGSTVALQLPLSSVLPVPTATPSL